jgi:hypothetical protein
MDLILSVAQKGSSLQKSVGKVTPMFDYRIGSWSKYTHTFCKLDCFITVCYFPSELK